MRKHAPEYMTSSSPGGLPGICSARPAARPALPPALPPIWLNLMFRTAADLARKGGAAAGCSIALFVMFLRGVVGVKNERMPPLPSTGASLAFFGGIVPEWHQRGK